MKNIYFLFVALLVSQITFAIAPIVPSLQPIHYCDPNNDGLGVFDLSVQNQIILNSQSGAASNYIITYHETPDSAADGTIPIDTPSAYDNITTNTQTIYVRIKDINTNEFAVGSFSIVVNPTPQITSVTDYALCDSNWPVGFETFDLTTKIPELLGALNPANHTVTFYTSLSSAQAGTNAIGPINSYVNNVNPMTIFARVTNNTTGCFDVAPFNLIVNPLPNSMQPNYPQYSLCDIDQTNIGTETFDLSSKINEILLGQTGMSVAFYPSLGDAQNGTQVITNLMYQNTVLYVQTLGIRITNNVTSCYVISTMDIRVEPLPTLVTPTIPYTVCDNNLDGISTFDLTSLIPDLLSGAAYNVDFFETINDAQAGVNAINNSSNYSNMSPFVQVIYARGSDQSTNCWSIIPITLVVNPSPVAFGLNDIAVCDADANPQNGSTTVDLTVVTTDLLTMQTLPASNYTVAFYASESAAELGTSPILPVTNYVANDGDSIWVRVENNTTGCYGIGSFGIEIDAPLLLTTPTPLSVCDDDANPNDQYHVFNLTVKNNEIAQGTGNIVTYYPSMANAQTDTAAISDPTAYTNPIPAIQTLGVAVTTPGGCRSLTSLDIRVLPIPTPVNNPPALTPQCDINDTGDMMEVFDLTVNAAYIINGDPTLTLHYYRDLSDALVHSNEILTPTAALVGSNVWIRVENNREDFQGNHCYVLVEQPLHVNPLPVATITSNNTLDTVYVDGGNNVIQPLLLDSGLSGNYSYQWYSDSVLVPNATNSTYLVNTASSNGSSRIFTVVVTDLDTQCGAVSSGLVVNQSGGVPPPNGITAQNFVPGATLADIAVSGVNIQWYASATNKNGMTTMSTPLPLNTVLVDGVTYYASQTVSGFESAARLPVTVHLLLGVPTNEIMPLQFSPNPVRNVLTLKSDVILKSVKVYNLLGQKVHEHSLNDSQASIDLSNLHSGNYILKAQSESGQKTIKIVKQ